MMTVIYCLAFALFFPPFRTWFTRRFGFISQLLYVGAKKWHFQLTYLMIYLITLNTLDLLPGELTPPQQLHLNLCFALPLWVVTVLAGRPRHPKTPKDYLDEGVPHLKIRERMLKDKIRKYYRPFPLAFSLVTVLIIGHISVQEPPTPSDPFELLENLKNPVIILHILASFLPCFHLAVALTQAFVLVMAMCRYLKQKH